MSAFSEVSIHELGRIYDGPHATPTRRNRGPYFLNIASLADGRLNLNESDHVSDEDFSAWTRRVTPQAGDLLFSYETRLGEAALMPAGVTACLGRRMALLRPDRKRVDARYLLYLYLSPQFQSTIAENTIHGATVNRISLTTMGQWIVRLPPLGLQSIIGRVLGSLDDKVESNNIFINTAADLAVAHLADLPAEVPLGALANLRRHTVNPADLLAESLVHHFSLPAFDASNRAEIVNPGVIKSSKFEIRHPSVLVSKLNPRFLRVWDVDRVPDEPALASTEFLVLEPRFCSTAVLWALLANPRFGRDLEEKVAGTSGSHQRVKPQDILVTPVANLQLVSREVQKRITSLGLLIASLRSENERLIRLRTTLLPQLVSGALRLKEATAMVSEQV